MILCKRVVYEFPKAMAAAAAAAEAGIAAPAAPLLPIPLEPNLFWFDMYTACLNTISSSGSKRFVLAVPLGNTVAPSVVNIAPFLVRKQEIRHS